MSRLKFSLLVGCVAAIATLGVHYRVRQNLMREAAHLRSANDGLRFEANQRREVLRGQESGLGAQLQEKQRFESPQAPHPDSNEKSRTPGAEYRNEGQATPVATLQTMAWASDHGDSALMEKLIFFDDAARLKAAAHLASMSPAARSQWTSLEAMAASLLTADGIHRPFPPAMILERATIEPINSERVGLRLPGTSRDRTEYQKTLDGWKFAITETMVDDYLNRLARTAQATR